MVGEEEDDVEAELSFHSAVDGLDAENAKAGTYVARGDSGSTRRGKLDEPPLTYAQAMA